MKCDDKAMWNEFHSLYEEKEKLELTITIRICCELHFN